MKSDAVKRDNRKALPKYLLILLAAAIFGGVMGFAAGWLGHDDLSETLADALANGLITGAPWAMLATSVVSLAVILVLYRGARRLFAGWDGESEEVMDRAGEKLNWALLLTTAQIVLDMFFFSAAIMGRSMAALWAVLGFIVSVFLLIFAQQKVVDLTRRMNPEKQGSVYDLHFRKKWLDSCDEAERREIGEAAYQAFIVTNSVCPFLWLAMVLLNFVFDLGLMPSAMVLLVWGCLQVSYTLACIRIRSHSTGGSISL